MKKEKNHVMGRPRIFNEATETISFRLPLSMIDKIKKIKKNPRDIVIEFLGGVK